MASSASKAQLRLKLQLEHLLDLTNEQNRMLLTQIEPTESDRREAMVVLEETRALMLGLGQAAREFRPAYEQALAELEKLSYNLGDARLDADSPGASPGTSPPSPRALDDEQFEMRPTKRVKHVRFGGVERFGSEQPEPAVSAPQLYDQNNELLTDQDRRLEQIAESVGRQHALGGEIYSELDVHNQLLDELDDSVDRSQHLMTRAANGVRSFNRKSREYGVCSLIMLLVLVLFILLLI